MKLKRILILLAILLISLFIVSCGNDGNGNASKDETRITGVTDIRVKVGEGSEDLLLQNVNVKLPDGSTEKPILVATDVNFNVSGKYSFEYKYKDLTVKAMLYVYGQGDMLLYYNGEPLTQDNITVSFGSALRSANFTQGVEVKDCFGSTCDLILTEESVKFSHTVGDYIVTYIAHDIVGNEFQKTITYTVVHTKNLSVDNGEKTYASGDITLNIGLDGETDVWLLYNEQMVKFESYNIENDKLTIKKELFYSLPTGDNLFTLLTLNDATDFTITLTDDGTPIFDLSGIVNSALYESKKNVLDFPNQFLAQHEYEYSYKLTDQNGVGCKVIVTDFGLQIVDSVNNNLKAGFYTLKVTATNKANTSKISDRTLKFRIYYDEKEFNAPQIYPINGNTFWQEVNIDDEIIYKYVANNRIAEQSRLVFTLNEGGYDYFGFDFKINGAIKYDNEGNNPKNLSDGEKGVELIYEIGGKTVAATFNEIVTGNSVNVEDLEIGKWYSARVSLIGARKKGRVSIYLNWDNTVDAEIYYKNINFFADTDWYDDPNKVLYATDSSKVLDVSALPSVADNTVHANNTAYLSSAQADNTLHANTPDSGYLAESDGVYTLTKVAGQSCAGSAGPNSFYIDNTIAATSLTFDIKFGDGKYLFPVNAGGEALFKPLSDYVTITNKTTGAPLALDSGADKDGYTGYLTYGDAWYTVTMDVTGINRIWVGLWDTGNSGTAQITGIAFSGGDEADYCLTKVAGVYCTPTGDAGFKFVNNGFNTVTFEMKPVVCRYLLIFNDSGMRPLKPFDSYVTMTNQTTGVNLAFDAEANAEGYTGYDIMDSSAWYTVTMNVTGLTNIWLAFWDGANEGSVLIKNVSFSGNNRPDADYVLTKTANQSCDSYGANAFWIENKTEASTLTFKMKSDDFNYVQLCNGNGSGYSTWYNAFTDGTIIITDKNGNKITCTDSDSGWAGQWTGEVLTTGEWYTFTVNVTGISDVGLVWWLSHTGMVLIKDIAFS